MTLTITTPDSRSPAGTYQANTTKAFCYLCARGTYMSSTGDWFVGQRGRSSRDRQLTQVHAHISPPGAEECALCDGGKYANYTGATYCFSCEDGYESREGSDSCDICSADYLMLRGGCAECKDDLFGADCSKQGQTLANVKLKPGYWRTAKTSTNLLECDNDWAVSEGDGACACDQGGGCRG